MALTHPSVAHEAPGAIAHNQRLEFLGDSVLSLVLTQELYEKFPMAGEGPLTKARAQMVNRRTLADQARRAGLGEHLIVSHGEEMSGGRKRPSSLGHPFEAVLRGIFLGGGFTGPREVIFRPFCDPFGELNQISHLRKP